MKRFVAIAFLLTFALFCAASDSEYLEPLSPFGRDDWLIRAQKIIFGKRDYFGMVVSPSLQNIYGVELSFVESEGSNVITKYVADIADVFNEEQEKKLANGSYTVSKTTKNISRDIADRIFWITVGIAKKAKYPDSPGGGVDGVTYMFSTGRYVGKTWCPDGGEPARLVSLWEALAKYAASNDATLDREILADINRQISDLSYLLPVSAPKHEGSHAKKADKK
ncbi:MAG TPA: hypothetical protein VFJ90_15170 [Candidatus Didemnitutus sp.]|nr:hypothetical protein [Candidatus Didemnitutus sp.]